MQTVTIRTPGELRTIRSRLDDPRPLLATIGLQLKRTSDRAFEEQRLGEIPWAARYPSQSEPFVNFAAVLERANRGRPPLSRDFERRPALRGTGDLQKSVRSRWEVTAKGGTVEARSDMSYAPLHQHGGTSSFEVSATARDVLRTWAVENRKDARAKKIMLLSYLHRWKQDVIARPFIGITDETSHRITQITEFFFATGAA